MDITCKIYSIEIFCLYYIGKIDVLEIRVQPINRNGINRNGVRYWMETTWINTCTAVFFFWGLPCALILLCALLVIHNRLNLCRVPGCRIHGKERHAWQRPILPIVFWFPLKIYRHPKVTKCLIFYHSVHLTIYSFYTQEFMGWNFDYSYSNHFFRGCK